MQQPNWADRVCCPRCGGAVAWSDLAVSCAHCMAEYPRKSGVPVLIDEQSSVFNPTDIVEASGTVTARKGLRRFVPPISLNLAASKNYRWLRRLLQESQSQSLVLIVGAGEGGEGASHLEADGIELVLSDVAIGPSTQICLDSHRIPFVDGTFDAVVVQAVLEHVVDPPSCVAEITRVLKPGGLVYAETPFMQQVHMGAWDFTRFTNSGHRRLFRRYEELGSGAAVGPGSALAWSIVYFFSSFARGPRSRQLLNIAPRFLFFWLKYFDLAVGSRDSALDGAAGVFFLGRLSEETISDRTLIAQYRGGTSVSRRERRGASRSS